MATYILFQNLNVLGEVESAFADSGLEYQNTGNEIFFKEFRCVFSHVSHFLKSAGQKEVSSLVYSSLLSPSPFVVSKVYNPSEIIFSPNSRSLKQRPLLYRKFSCSENILNVLNRSYSLSESTEESEYSIMASRVKPKEHKDSQFLYDHLKSVGVSSTLYKLLNEVDVNQMSWATSFVSSENQNDWAALAGHWIKILRYAASVGELF